VPFPPPPMRPFPFPYAQPYDIQSRFMAELYGTIKTRRMGIFESPTGTVRAVAESCRGKPLAASAEASLLTPPTATRAVSFPTHTRRARL
jgi:Rad3-related DNA helicase